MPGRGPSDALRQVRTTQQIAAPAALRYWHLLSLDAPTVAIVWSLAFAWAAQVRVAPWVLALEALVVWTVYVGDRLLDARRGVAGDGEGMRDRHWFHWRHRRALAPLAIAAAAVGACIAIRWMPARTWGNDSLVGIASLAYFARVHGGRTGRRAMPKEVLVGVLFTAGCALPSFSLEIAVPVVGFATIAWLNCWAIERWESRALPRNVAKTAILIALAGALVGVSIFHAEPRAALVTLSGSVSAALLAALDRIQSRIAPVALRAWADFVLLTPAILMAAGRWAR